jgi:hypothetical protein
MELRDAYFDIRVAGSLAIQNEIAMNTYEIRIVRKDIKSPDVYSSSHISDHAAIRRARNLADREDKVEVWRGTTCVYSGGIDQVQAH